MSPHLGPDELVLHHYGESDDPAAPAAHLAECEACAGALRELRDLLALVPAAEPPALRPARAAELWSRARGPRDVPVDFKRRPSAGSKVARMLPQHLAAWGALAASLIFAFWMGRQLPSDAPAPVARERVLLVAVGQHLERTRMVLVELSNTPGRGPARIASEQQWAASLLAENRLYRLAAHSSGDSGVVGVLEELERVLAEVANGPDVLSARQLEDLRTRIEARGLIFKVKVVEGQVRARTRRAASAPKEMS
jgi:hypothetical protein